METYSIPCKTAFLTSEAARPSKPLTPQVIPYIVAPSTRILDETLMIKEKNPYGRTSMASGRVAALISVARLLFPELTTI